MDFKELYKHYEGIKIQEPSTIKRKIEYKKLQEKRFKKKGYEVKSTTLTKKGRYITDQLCDKINLDTNSTVIVNAGVGEGKTVASHRLIKKCVKKGYKVIDASPFIALTERDREALEGEVTVTHYHDIGSKDNAELVKNDVQIITINSLLANPGDYEQQSPVKKDYLIALREYCENNNQKVIFFFDEIHAGVKSFITEFRDEIYKWKESTHKCIVFSATFTEGAYPVLGIISDLTSKKVLLINCPRKHHTEVSDLHLLFTYRRYSKSNLSPLNILEPVLEDAKSDKRTINILTATKSIANELVDRQKKEKVAQYIAGQNPNLLTSETNDENKFKEGRINIGTTFGTGFSINDKDALYIIILPAYLGGMENIFANGRSAIIQAIARQRRKGDIVIVSTVPKGMIEGNYLDYWPDDLSPEYTTSYLPLSKQRSIIKEEYTARKNLSEDSAELIGREIEFDAFDFQMVEAPKLLASKKPIYGKSVIPFIIWAAMNNQFINTKLRTCIYFDPEWESFDQKNYKVSSRNIFDKLNKLVSDTISKQTSELDDWDAYEEIIEDVKFDNESSNQITFTTKEKKPRRNKIIYNGTALSHDQMIRHPKVGQWALTKLYNLRFDNNEDYKLSNYINDQIYYAERYKNLDKLTGGNSNLIAAYVRLGIAKNFLIGKANINDQLIESSDLNMDILTKVCQTHTIIGNEDHFIKNRIFSFLRSIDGKYQLLKGTKLIIDIDVNDFKKKVFKQLVKAFFEVKIRRVPDGKVGRKRVKEITSIHQPTGKRLNFLI